MSADTIQAKPPASPLPVADQLAGLLNLESRADVTDLLDASLLNPLREFMSRPAKRFRARLVELGYRLAGEKAPLTVGREETGWCAEAAEALEALHAGSLVVDDIEDQSSVRRGQPTLHLRHGLATALNAGNWLYFWPFEQIRRWNRSPETEVRLYRVCHEALLRAHFGQALDVGTFVDELPQARIPEVCIASLELKTGALTSLATRLGAVLGNASEERLEALDAFGRRFGVALQMFDDIGNLVGKTRENDPKRYEDLKLRRPSWIWAVVAQDCTPEAFRRFAKVVSELPNASALESWLATYPIAARAKARAHRYLERAFAGLRRELNKNDFEAVLTDAYELGAVLRKAYE